MIGLLVAAVLAICTPGVVTDEEFAQAQVGMTKHHVQYDLWDAKGEFAVTYYDETGDEHRVRRYYRPDGSTFLVDWQRRYGRHHFRFDHAVDQ